MASQHRAILSIVAIGISIILLGASYLVGGIWGFSFMVGLLLLAFIIFTFFTTNYVTLNEMEVGVVFSRRGNFVCFLDNDYGRIYPRKSEDEQPRKLVKPITLHKINPATEVLKSILRKGSFSASGTSSNVRTREGIPVNIPWSLSFKIDVTQIRPGIEHKLARALPDNADNMLAGRMAQIIQHVVGKRTIQELYETQSEDGSAIQRLEDEIRGEIETRTSVIGVTTIAPHDFKIGPIQLPAEIENALRTAYKRTLQTEMVAAALTTLREAVGAFTQEDMDRLTDLERLRIIDEKTKFMTMNESFVNSRKEKNVRFFDEERVNENGNGSNQE